MARPRLLVLFVCVASAFALLAQETRAPLPPGICADLVVVDKSERRLTLFRAGRELRTYRVALGPNSEGEEIEEIWRVVRDGTPIEIRP